jgi:hypothetical protein
VTLFGLKKSPSDTLDPVTGSAKNADRAVAGALEHADTMTEEDYAKARMLLLKKKKDLAATRGATQQNIAATKAEGTEGGLSDWVTETVGQASDGNWGKALMTLVAPSDSKDWASVKARAGNVASGEESVKEASAEERQLDEEIDRLDKTHELIRGTNTLLNQIVINTKPSGGGAGGKKNNGLDPTE